jgi:CheY-like chemotaxis protein
MGIIHVLFVDDDPDILALYPECLRNADIGVDTARSAHEALQKMQQYLPELVIADVQMAGMSGLEFCHKVREMGHDDVAFVFLSVLGSVPDKIQGLRCGAEDYLVKPIDPLELLLKVQSILQRNGKRRKKGNGDSFQQTETTMSGNLADIAAYEVLQLLEIHGSRFMHAHFETEGGTAGDVYVASGEVVHSATDGVSGAKAFFRILGWNRGRFSVFPRGFIGHPSMAGPLKTWILQGVTHMDDFARLRNSLRECGRYFSARYDADLLEHHSEPQVLLMMGLVERHPELEELLERSSLTDLATCRILDDLLKIGLVRASREPPAAGD